MNQVLEEIGTATKPTLMVFNKTDRFDSRERLQQFLERFPNGVGVSAKTGDGFPELLGQLGSLLRPIRQFVELKIPHEQAALIARLHAVAQVVERSFNGRAAKFKARIPPHLRGEFSAFIVRDLDERA